MRNLLKTVKGISQIPNDYIPLTYIQSSGTQMIDTGIKLSNEDVVETEIQMTADVGALYGTYVSSGSQNMSTTLYCSVVFYIYGDKAVKVDIQNYDKNWHRVHHDLTNGIMLFDDIEKTFSTKSSFVNTANCNLFARYYSSYGYNASAKMKYFRVIRSGQTIIDLVAVKKKLDNEIGMYDKISGEFFGNVGTGDFTGE